MHYRCPVDDCVFQTQKVDRVPTLQGHPECPGPECQAKLASGFFDEFLQSMGVKVAPAPQIAPAPAPQPQAPTVAAAPAPAFASAVPSGQGW